MPETENQKLYSVELRKDHDSAYLFRCGTPEEADGLYLQDIIDGNISVDSATVHELNELAIREFPGKEGHPGRLRWEDIPNIHINASEHPVWMDAIASGFDPDNGTWPDETDGPGV